MRTDNKGPHSRPQIRLVAVVVVYLAPVMDPTTADITVTVLTTRTMTSSRR